MDISKLKQKRTTSRSGFTRALNSIKKGFEVNALPQMIKIRFEKLNKAWNKQNIIITLTIFLSKMKLNFSKKKQNVHIFPDLSINDIPQIIP